jgi:hypothetical protein
MRREIQCVSKEAQQKALALSSSSEKIKHLEKALKQKTEILDRKEAELKVGCCLAIIIFVHPICFIR